jgi:crotonobetainyl-CoA:carnitine CoA-transferase CaiB-like acyl-CoA transferase
MPLSGIKVVEACSNIAGPVTGTIFGDLGADVIKIEKRNGGDDARGWAPPMLAGMAARFQAINRNKRSVTLDLKNADDQERLKKLISESDVFVHNMRPGVAESLGLSGPGALALNPRLIYCAIGAYGTKGPWRTWSAYDGLAQALSSQMYGNGEPDGSPLLVADAIVDKGAGMWAAIATLAALHERTKTGKGSVVETSLLEAALFYRDGVFAQYVASGKPPGRPGSGSANIVPYGVFSTADRPIMLGCAGDALFAGFAKLVGHSEWIQDPKFSENRARVANRVQLEALIEQALAFRLRDEWVDIFGKNGIPCAPILDPAEAYSHPQVQAVGIFQSPPDIEMPLVSAAWTINGVRPAVKRRAPQLGEDNDAVFGHGSALQLNKKNRAGD